MSSSVRIGKLHFHDGSIIDPGLFRVDNRARPTPEERPIQQTPQPFVIDDEVSLKASNTITFPDVDTSGYDAPFMDLPRKVENLTESSMEYSTEDFVPLAGSKSYTAGDFGEQYEDPWNRRFQRACRKLAQAKSNLERMKRADDFGQLEEDFLYLARTYGRIIISEVNLPDAEKTIKPTNLGGVAGGVKYQVHNILFKFPVNDRALYSTVESAIKVAGHELKGLLGCMNARIDGLNFPFIVLLDYRGYRLLCMSTVPISSATLVLGSENAGRVVKDSDEKLRGLIQQMGAILNLRPHRISPTVSAHTPCDLEAHKGRDGNYYLLDFARVFPPEALIRREKGVYLYRLLRPEFVAAYEKPLCNDTFSAFMRHEPLAQRKEFEHDINEASAFLRGVFIPRAARYYDRLSAEVLDWTNVDVFLHRYGINLRYLGLFLDYLTQPYPRMLTLVEIIARLIKHGVRRALREELVKHRLPQGAGLSRALLKYFDRLWAIDPVTRRDAWQDLISNALHSFHFSDSSNFIRHLQDQHRENQIMCRVFARATSLLGLLWHPSTYQFQTTDKNSFPRKRPFDSFDLEGIPDHVKRLSVISFSMGYRLKTKARNSAGGDTFLQQAIEHFNTALGQHSFREEEILLQKADALHMLGKNLAAKHEYMELLMRQQVRDKQTALRFALFLEDTQEHSEALRFFLLALTLDPYDAETLGLFSLFVKERSHAADLAERLQLQASFCANLNSEQLGVLRSGDTTDLLAFLKEHSASSRQSRSTRSPPMKLASLQLQDALLKSMGAEEAPPTPDKEKERERERDREQRDEHDWHQQSFSKTRVCSDCRRYLWGALLQGFKCSHCGLVAHRACLRRLRQVACVPASPGDRRHAQLTASTTAPETLLAPDSPSRGGLAAERSPPVRSRGGAIRYSSTALGGAAGDLEDLIAAFHHGCYYLEPEEVKSRFLKDARDRLSFHIYVEGEQGRLVVTELLLLATKRLGHPPIGDILLLDSDLAPLALNFIFTEPERASLIITTFEYSSKKSFARMLERLDARRRPALVVGCLPELDSGEVPAHLIQDEETWADRSSSHFFLSSEYVAPLIETSYLVQVVKRRGLPCVRMQPETFGVVPALLAAFLLETEQLKGKTSALRKAKERVMKKKRQ